MAAKTLEAALALIDDLVLNQIEYSPETRDLLHDLYSIRQRKRRSNELEKGFGNLKKPAKEETKVKFIKYSPDDFQKKTMTSQVDAPHADVEVPDLPPPSEFAESKSQTNEGELLDIVTDGIDKAKANFKTAKAFQKKLSSIGVEATGKTHEELFEAAKEVFENISR